MVMHRLENIERQEEKESGCVEIIDTVSGSGSGSGSGSRVGLKNIGDKFSAVPIAV